MRKDKCAAQIMFQYIIYSLVYACARTRHALTQGETAAAGGYLFISAPKHVNQQNFLKLCNIPVINSVVGVPEENWINHNVECVEAAKCFKNEKFVLKTLAFWLYCSIVCMRTCRTYLPRENASPGYACKYCNSTLCSRVRLQGSHIYHPNHSNGYATAITRRERQA